MQPAQRPGPYEIAGRAVTGVEAAHEAQLQDGARGVDIGQGAQRALEVQCDRLLAEGGQSGPRGAADQVGVGGGGGGDDDGVHAPGEDLVHRGGGRGARTVGDVCGSGRVRVGDDQGADLAMAAQHLRVEGADTAGADKSDAHGPQGGLRPVAMSSVCPDIQT